MASRAEAQRAPVRPAGVLQERVGDGPDVFRARAGAGGSGSRPTGGSRGPLRLADHQHADRLVAPGSGTITEPSVDTRASVTQHHAVAAPFSSTTGARPARSG